MADTVTDEAAEIVFDNATKRYGNADTAALDQLSLTVHAGEICALVGPSGGGKTTALTLVNRMADLTSGDIRIGGTSINDLDPISLRRGIGYVIQQTGLFPHMTVEANIGLVPKILGWDARRTSARAHELLSMVGLAPAEDMAARYPNQLSGGQQQRVGIARALAADPQVMLMDEPFGALDPITRVNLQDEFLKLHAKIRKTALFVTHDIDEAIKMGDRIAILREGGILAQCDTPERILTAPADDFVREFVGADRALKRLALLKIADAELDPLGDPPPTGWPTVSSDASLREGLSEVLAHGADGLVVQTDGRPVGLMPMQRLRDASVTAGASS
ncbi:ABC transporter ATP-binding protein [Spelaeicoccus albus]|uniref:ABC-type quaternary amine transporter n=1 Tax=Spelaeicoccus albus TaxID=1280376 RepID=A0A7Z0ABC9_9MICO|nr:ABC transporter ATP-binding protein [Spelaeicoccus albus]NYI67066.1 osmoprotectant transport system ATP-binding protein [Spelaeicoccus albus]